MKKSCVNFITSLFLFIACILCNSQAYAREIIQSMTYGRVTKLPLPRFVSLKGNQTYMRSGPGKDYALLWIYQKKGLPVEIIDEYEQWRRIRDLDGSEGWIHQSVLSGRRMVVTLEGTHNVYQESDRDSDVVAMVDGDTIATLEKCTDYYCCISHEKFSGWILKDDIYGIYDEDKDNFN